MRLLLLILLMTLGLIANDKVALVIANKNYINQTGLNNPINDAKLLKQTLEGMGFEVTPIYNKSKTELSRELDTFANKARNAKIAVVYYAGHGVGVNGVNYLVPIGASRLSVYNLGSKLMNLEELKGAVSEAKGFGVVFFDACRNSFFNERIEGVALSKDGASRALVQPTVRRGQNILVSFSTKAGKIAKDDVNNGDHSPYAIALSEKLPLNKDIRLVMGGVKDRVRSLTQYQQQPVNEDSLGERTFCLGCGTQPPPPPVPTGVTIIDGLMYQNQPFSSQDKSNYDNNKNGGRVWDWQGAKRYCQGLTLGGYSDWRLPNREELQKVANIELYHAYGDYKTNAEWKAQHLEKAQQHFDNNKHKRNRSSRGYKYFVKKEFVENMPPLNGKYKYATFWSSTERDSSYAWFVNFYDGDDRWYYKAYQRYAVCVR